MSLYFFRIRNGPYCGASNNFEVANRDAAWTEMTKVCGDLVGGIARHLAQGSEWQMELLDESKEPVFRIRLVAETVNRRGGPTPIGAGVTLPALAKSRL